MGVHVLVSAPIVPMATGQSAILDLSPINNGQQAGPQGAPSGALAGDDRHRMSGVKLAFGL